ncbi:hypothetical protein LR69_00174 [Geobacillus sp. BCO2]|nr:hypothetical protein LR69_00174 [Geobacillus sp. BCO2]
MVALLYELSILLYIASILFYFIDFLQQNRKANDIAFWLLSIVWLLQTVTFVSRIMETKRFPILTMSEGLYFYAWLLITLSLVINRLLRVDFIVFFTNVLAFFYFGHSYVRTVFAVAGCCGAARFGAAYHPHYPFARSVCGVYAVVSVFGALHVAVQFAEKEKVGGAPLAHGGFVAA